MRGLIVFLLILINAIIEPTLLQYTRIYGIKPDFVLMLIVSYSILRGSSYGLFIGLGAGLLFDMLYAKVFGINALAYMITGYIIGKTHENVFKDSYLPAITFNFIAVFIFQHLNYVLLYFTNNLSYGDVSYVYFLLKIIIPQSIYNTIVGVIVYRYIFGLDHKPFMNRRLY